MATYTAEQVDRYLQHIRFPRDRHPASDRLALLAALQRHHIARVPFDSVALHYSPHRLLSLDPADLFDKIVVHSRGGYCMEVNTLFAAVLKSLGFQVYSAGGRVNHDRWNHMVNIVTVNETKYLVDVGYGRREPVQPVPLVPTGFEFAGIAPTRSKLERKPLPRHSPGQSVWVYSARMDDSTAADGWEEQYSFTDVEFFLEDFELMNYFVMTKPQSYFVQTVLAYRAIMDEETGELVGEILLHKDSVKRVLRGHEQTLEHLQTEEQRVAALEKYFFMSLTEKEKQAIKGLASELKAS